MHRFKSIEVQTLCNPVPVTEAMKDAIGADVLEAYLDRDLLLVLQDENTVINLKPDQKKMGQLDGLLVGVTAKGTDYDCISRIFAPKMGVEEDPVTGSTHCMITPYWCNKLGKVSIGYPKDGFPDAVSHEKYVKPLYI